MTDEYTPGPWTVGNSAGWDMPIVEANGHRIATMERNNYRATTALSAPAKAEDETNARLIAAAPDLLEALEKVVINIEDFINPNGEFDFTPEAGRKMVKECEAAIEAAKGDA